MYVSIIIDLQNLVEDPVLIAYPTLVELSNEGNGTNVIRKEAACSSPIASNIDIVYIFTQEIAPRVIDTDPNKLSDLNYSDSVVLPPIEEVMFSVVVYGLSNSKVNQIICIETNEMNSKRWRNPNEIIRKLRENLLI